jgi:thiopeptide-type bacteriocin biosynthesis protein
VRDFSASHAFDIRWVAYEPEVDRYGGPEALVVAERLFEVSSHYALAVIRKSPSMDRETRLAKALLAMLVTTQAFFETPDTASRILQAYASSYMEKYSPNDQALWAALEQSSRRRALHLSEYVVEVWERLTGGAPLTVELDQLREGARTCADELRKLVGWNRCLIGGIPARSVEQAFRAIVPSYIHMTSNRIGATIQEETSVAHTLSRALASLAM